MSIHERLKAERERLHLSQPSLATLASVGKTTVINWEKGASAPDAVQLAAIASAGADVLYILTGRRSQAVAEVALLPADERALVEAFRRCNADARRHLIQSAALLSAGMGVSPPAAAPSRVKHQPDLRGLKQTSNTPGAVQVGYAAGKVSIKRR